MSQIAGHTFVDGPEGKKCACGKLWLDVAPASRADIGQAGWAHAGSLTEAEYNEIDRERERIWEVGKGA